MKLSKRDFTLGLSLVVLGTLSGLISGCANLNGVSDSSQGPGGPDQFTTSGARSAPATASDANSGSTTTTTDSSTSSSGAGKLAPILIKRVGAVGYRGVTLKIPAKSRLKITVQAEQNDEKVAGTGFTPLEHNMGVFVAVGKSSRPTPLMNAIAQEQSPVMDFTSQIDPKTDMQTIMIYKPNSDARCIMFNYGCPYEHVYTVEADDTHEAGGYPWHVTLFISTETTEDLQ